MITNLDQLYNDINHQSIDNQVQKIYYYIFKESSTYFVKNQNICPFGFCNETNVYITTYIIDTDQKMLCKNIHDKIAVYMNQRTYNFKKKIIDMRNLWCAEFYNWLKSNIFSNINVFDIYTQLYQRRSYVETLIMFKVFKPGNHSNISMQDLLYDIYIILNKFLENIFIKMNQEKDNIIERLNTELYECKKNSLPIVPTNNIKESTQSI